MIVTLWVDILLQSIRGTAVTAKVFQVSLVIRLFRVVRLVRIMKLVSSPLTRDLANMLVGFVVGAPSLLWVLVLLCMVIFASGIMFRYCLGPTPGQNLVEKCGLGDDLPDDHDPACAAYLLYGEEFFGTVAKSMFTSFRFMLGDYSTRGGKSVAVAFSRGYGWPFDLAFVTSMIVVTFGCFNIITAIFVDSTISGLKRNDLKRKFERQYERSWVREKLKAIVARMKQLKEELDEDAIEIDQEDFIRIMEDHEIQTLLADLDIRMFNPAGSFEIFDPNHDGRITMPEFVRTLMKLRGDPQKSDIITSSVSLFALHNKVDKFQVTLLDNQSAVRAMSQRIGCGSDLPPRTSVVCSEEG